LLYTVRMGESFGFIYAIVLCAFGGMFGQMVYGFFRPKLGMVWAGGIAGMIAFLLMVAFAAGTQFIFGYPPIQPASSTLDAANKAG